MLGWLLHKYARIRVFTDPYFLPYKDRIVDSLLIRENTGSWKAVFSHILCSAFSIITVHLWIHHCTWSYEVKVFIYVKVATVKLRKVRSLSFADKVLVECSPRELWERLETVLLARRILLLECHSWYVSHMTKSCILKILNLKQNLDCNLFRS